MANGDRANAALALSGGAAIAAALAWLASRPKGVAAAEGTFPPEAMQLLAAIASGIERLSPTEATGAEEPSLSVKGYPPNQSGIIVSRRVIAALGQWYEFPDIPVPEGYTVLFKGWPTNAGVVYVAGSRNEAGNIETVYPLLANEFVRLQIQNFNQVYVSGLAAGGSFVNDIVVAIVEFPRGKGG